jgi:potassium/chloride transporter 8
MMTYAAIDYAYFALAMSYDRRQEKELKYGPINKKKLSSGGIGNGCVGYGTYAAQTRPKDSFEKLASDLDSLFPERMTQRGQHHLVRQSSANSNATTPEADFDATKQHFSAENDKANLLPEKNLVGTGRSTSFYQSFRFKGMNELSKFCWDMET